MVMRGKEGDDKVMEAGSGLISIWNMINPTGNSNIASAGAGRLDLNISLARKVD